MDKAYIFTPRIAAEIMMFSTVNAMAVTFICMGIIKTIVECYAGKRICIGIHSLFLKIRKKIHG